MTLVRLAVAGQCHFGADTAYGCDVGADKAFGIVNSAPNAPSFIGRNAPHFVVPPSYSPVMTPSTSVLERFDAVVDELCALPVWQLPGPTVADVLERLESARRRLAFAGIRAVADIDARNVAGEQAGISTVEFLSRRLRIAPSDAKSRLRAARELLPSVAPSGETVPAQLPTTATGVAEGALSLEHARVISRAVEKLPTGLDPQIRAEVETELATHARDLDPAQLTTAARRVHTILDPDGALDADLPARRELSFVRDAGGCDLLRGRLDAEAAAMVRSAIDAVSAPGPRDARTPARRCADGLVELCRRYLDSGQLPTQGGEKPHITVTMRLADLSATLGTGQPVTAEAARRLACDASIVPVVLGAAGEPLDVGRATRTIPPAIRRALVVRDKGCIHPGCPKLAEWCDAHHVIPWLDGGATAVDNLVLLCSAHHWIVHHTAWRITFIDGIPHVIPPPLIDPGQRPQRNTLHDTG